MRVRQVLNVCLALVLLAVALPAAADDRADVTRVVTDAYIRGVHIDRDTAAMRAGFHPDFRMLVLGADGTMSAVTLAEWMGRIEKAVAAPNAPKPPAIRYEFVSVDVQGTAAVVSLKLWRNEVLTFTDFLSLYKCADGWKIVSKTYFTHPRP